MGSILRPQDINQLVITSSTLLTLPGNNVVNIGARQFVISNQVINTAVVGLNGLDVALVASTLYYVYAVYYSGAAYLIASSSSAPAGYTFYKQVAAFYVDGSGNVVSTYFFGKDGNLPFISEEVILREGNGYGSTNTYARRFTNIEKNTSGKVIQYTDSATDGSYFTALKNCEAYVAWSDDLEGSGVSIPYYILGLVVNSVELSTPLGAITDFTKLRAVNGFRIESSAYAVKGFQVSYSGPLNEGDVLHFQSDPNSAFSNGNGKTMVTFFAKEI